jgi:hypothetical protein
VITQEEPIMEVGYYDLSFVEGHPNALQVLLKSNKLGQPWDSKALMGDMRNVYILFKAEMKPVISRFSSTYYHWFYSVFTETHLFLWENYINVRKDLPQNKKGEILMEM